MDIINSPVIAAIINQIPVLVPVLILLWQNWRIQGNVLKIEKATNSMMEKREVAAEKLGHDRGMAAQKTLDN